MNATVSVEMEFTADSNAPGDWVIPANDPDGEFNMDTGTNLHNQVDNWAETGSFTYTSNDAKRFFRVKKSAAP